MRLLVWVKCEKLPYFSPEQGIQRPPPVLPSPHTHQHLKSVTHSDHAGHRLVQTSPHLEPGLLGHGWAGGRACATKSRIRFLKAGRSSFRPWRQVSDRSFQGKIIHFGAMSSLFKSTVGLFLFSGLKKNVPHKRWMPLSTLSSKITVFVYEYHYFFSTLYGKKNHVNSYILNTVIWVF